MGPVLTPSFFWNLSLTHAAPVSSCPFFFLPPSLAPPPSFAALVQIPLLLRGRGGVVGGEGVGERTAVSLSTALLSPPSATLVSSVCGCARARTLVCHSVGFSGSSDAGYSRLFLPLFGG